MKGWIRLGLVLSVFWLVGVLFFSISEFFNIPSSSCIFIIDPYLKNSAGENYLSVSESLKTSLFSCNVYSQLISNSWQRYFILIDSQIVEFNIKHFAFLLFIPLAIFWVTAVSLAKSIHWIINGFKVKKP